MDCLLSSPARAGQSILECYSTSKKSFHEDFLLTNAAVAETEEAFRAKHKKALKCINYSFTVTDLEDPNQCLYLCTETKEDYKGWLSYFRKFAGQPAAPQE